VRLHRLELTSYGAFSKRPIDIGPGLTVVYGPNESGKSTLRHAIGDVLWGIQPRLHPYAFLVNPSQLRLTATVTESSGQDEPDGEITLTFDSRGCRRSDNVAVEPWWRTGPVTTRDAWTKALGLDLAGLRSGGRRVLDDGGDLASLLFRARTGIDVTQALEALTARAEAAYKRRAGVKGPIRTLLADAKRTRQETADATSSAAEVARLRAEATSLMALNEDAKAAHAKREVAHGAAEEALRAWEPAAKLLSTRHRLSQLRSLGRVIDATGLDAYDKSRRELIPLSRQLAEVAEELAALDRRLALLVVDEAALAAASTVEDLQTRQELEKRRLDDLAGHSARLDAVREEICQVVVSLAPGSWDATRVETSEEPLRSVATSLLIPADVADRIRRGAQELRDVEDEIRIEAGEVATARKHLTDLDPSAADPASRAGLHESREMRDRAWAEVRKPWLSGALPDDQTRTRLADAVDVRTRNADELSDRAISGAEGTGRVLEVNAQLADRIAHLDELWVRHGARTKAWAGLLTEAGVPSVVDPAAWDVRSAALETLADRLHEEHRLTSAVASDQRAVSDYASDVAKVGTSLGIPGTDTWAVLSDAIGHVTDTRKNQAAAKALRESHDKATRKREALSGKQAGFEAVVTGLRADDDLDEVVQRSQDAAAEREREQTYLEQVRHAARAGTDLEDLVTRLIGLEAADLETQEADARTNLDAALEARDAARDALLGAQASLNEAEQVGDAATMHAREIEAAEVLAAEVVEYVQAKVMIAALERLLAAEEPDHDTALLTHASSLACRLTGGRVTGLTVEERAGERRLRIEAVGLGEGIPEELSQGTADQVYLALRLAGIRQMQMRAVAEGVSTLPVVFDDILVTHDDGRTAVALEVLAEEAQDQQILLMTHHSAVAEAARLTSAKVVTLTPLAQLAVTTPPGL
jgi:uncharacterized protein YhaN